MTGPPRKLKIAIHMLRRFPERAQTGNDGHNRNAQQDATGGLCIPYRRTDLILQAWVTQGIRDGIETLQYRPGECEEVTPRNRQGVETEGFDLGKHGYSAALSAEALASRLATSAAAPLYQSLIAGHE